MKCSQLHLILVNFKKNDPKHFCYNLQVSLATFDCLEQMIAGHLAFLYNSFTSQGPLSAQLATALFWFGHNENGASVKAVAQWAGISTGTVINWTCRVIIVFLALHNSTIHWPSEEEKEEAKEWVELVSFYAWQDGFCIVDRMATPLFQRPGYHSESYFVRIPSMALSAFISIFSSMWLTLFTYDFLSCHLIFLLKLR
jgi:hypothetical protein